MTVTIQNMTGCCRRGEKCVRATRPASLLNVAVVMLLAGLALSGAQSAHAQKYETYTGFRVDTAPVLPDAEVHPSLYFDASELDELRARIPETYDEPYGPTWFRFRTEALDFLGDDPAAADENDRPKMAKTLAFWWIMMQDSTALRGAIDALLLAYEGVPQTDGGDYDEIYRATWIQNYSEAYDWVHDQLTPEEDEEIRRRIADEAGFLHENLSDFGRPHNHVSKPAWSLATAALTLSDHSDAAGWLQNALEQLNIVTGYQFSADGIYREGGHYWMYSAVNMIPFLWHYLNVSGVDLFPDYRPAFVWPVKVRMGRGYIPNIEDSYLKPAPTHMVAAQYLDAVTDLNPDVSLGNVLQWNWNTTELFTSAYTGATNDVAWNVDEFILWDQSIPAAAPSRSPTINMDGGQTVFRNSWGGGRDHRYLLFHGVPEGDNHGHPDLLSFVAEAYDAYLIADAGYGPDGFSDDMRETWYTREEAHNIVEVNGMPPWAAIPSNETPPTPYFIDSEFFDFAEKRLERFLRNEDVAQRRAIAFVGEDYWVVTDILTADEEKAYQAYLHGRGRFSRTGHHATWETFDDAYGLPARLDAYLLPSTAQFTDDRSYISLFKDGRRTSYVVMEVEAEDVALMQVLLPALPDDPPPALVDLSTGELTAARVQRGTAVDRFIAQPTSTLQSVENVTTDGTFAWTREVDGIVRQIAVREARSIAVEGSIDVTTDVDATFAIDFSDPERWQIHATSPRPQAVSATIWHPDADAVDAVAVGSTEVDFARAGDGAITLDFTAVATAMEPAAPDVPRPGSLELSAYPNPFTSSARLSFASGDGGRYRLAVYDMLGRRVAAWNAVRATPGTFTIEWDGIGADGRPLPSGTYFVRLHHQGTGASTVRTLVRIR